MASRSLYGSLLSAVAICAAVAANARQPDPWFSSWAAPPVQPYPDVGFEDVTTRQTIHLTLGGTRVRLRISNLYGATPLVVGAAQIAKPGGTDTIDIARIAAFTFGGFGAVTIPVGAVVVSDPARFAVPANTDCVISIYTTGAAGQATAHMYASRPASTSRGNVVSSATLPKPITRKDGVFFVSGLDVAGTERTLGVVAFGDSITDGVGSTPGTATSWPNDVAASLISPHGDEVAVADAGIASGRLLSDVSPGINQSGLARADRDVFALPGVHRVILALGINDLAAAGASADPTPADILAGYRQFVERARERRIAVTGATITPAAMFPPAFEAKREAINAAIRAGGIFDDVVDFDAAVRDPTDRSRLSPAYDSGDHIHPNTAGYRAMADAVVALPSMATRTDRGSKPRRAR